MNNSNEVILSSRKNGNGAFRSWITDRMLPGIFLLVIIQAIALGTLSIRTHQKLIDLEIYLKEDIEELKRNVAAKASSQIIYRECEKINLQEALREEKMKAWTLYRIELTK
ncbi:hypothetical protein LCGC14_0337020 [marine sediment metagenome]|uniref:Cell division protein FtsL n=1 Tax=marine sediment metagenome TaxID=412755 RepID=A0A0F9TEP3_9ZZZZ